MKKIKYFYMVSFLLFLAIMSCAENYYPEVAAWRNQRKGRGYSYAQSWWNYKEDYLLNNGLKHYGTHDWIAESALQILYEKCYNQFIEALYINTNDLKWWYLLGTEVPDSRLSYQVYLLTRCQNWVTNVIGGVYSDHRLRFETFDSEPTGALLSYVDNVAGLVGESFSWRDCQRAAYLLGVMCHLIADASYYPHVKNIQEDGALHDIRYASCVQMLTNTIYPLRTTTDFFSDIGVDLSVGFPLDHKELPSLAVREAARITRWGTSYYLDAADMHYLFYPKTEYWPLLPGSTVDIDYEKINTWTMVTRAQINLDTTAKRYFDTVGHSLYLAIYHAAAAMNYLIDIYYIDCDCTGQQGEDGQMEREIEPMGERIDEAASLKTELELFDFMGAFGVVMTLAAISIVKKLNELAKLHDIKSLEKLLSPIN